MAFATVLLCQIQMTENKEDWMPNVPIINTYDCLILEDSYLSRAQLLKKSWEREYLKHIMESVSLLALSFHN